MAGGGTKVVAQAIAGNLFITIIKFVGWFFSQSPSMLAEAIHSLADTFNQVLLFVGIKQAKKKASRAYSTGLGGASYVWNLVSAVGVFFIGFGVTFYHGMHSLLLGNFEVGNISWLAIAILVIAFIIEFYVLLGAFKEVNRQRNGLPMLDFFKETDDPTVIAVLLEDGVAVLGVLLALIGICLGQVFGSAIFDIIVSLVISFLLAFLGIALGIINGKLLMGKSVAVHKESEIKIFVESLKQVDQVNSLSTKIIGTGKVRLSLEIELHGEKIIDKSAVVLDVKKLEGGENPTKILMKASERMVRLTGYHINQMENQIQAKFPEITLIDLEIN
jgi:zinc transporter 9